MPLGISFESIPGDNTRPRPKTSRRDQERGGNLLGRGWGGRKRVFFVDGKRGRNRETVRK